MPQCRMSSIFYKTVDYLPVSTIVRFNRKSEEYQRECAIYQIFIYQLRLEKIPQETSAFLSPFFKQTANAIAINARLLHARE